MPDTKTLLSVAARMPERPDELARIKGVSLPFVQRFGTWCKA